MDTRALNVFLSVAETLSFSRSGELLHMSVSAVSRTVRRLEEELGQPLLERDNRRVSLTPAGAEFRDYARRALDEWQQLRRRLDSDEELAGEVSLFCSVTASYSVLAPILATFRSSHPAVEIMMHTGDPADGINRVLQRQDDLAVTARPATLSRRLEFLPLLESPLEFWLPTAECAVRKTFLSTYSSTGAIDWDDLPFIVPERGPSKDMLDDWFSEQGIRPRVYAQVAGHEAIIAMVGLGLGIGIAPRLVVEASGMEASVSRIDPGVSLPPLVVGLCALRQGLSSPQVNALWDVAGQTYSSGF